MSLPDFLKKQLDISKVDRIEKKRGYISAEHIAEAQKIVDSLNYSIEIKPNSVYADDLAGKQLKFVSCRDDSDGVANKLVDIIDVESGKITTIPRSDIEFLFPMNHFILGEELGLVLEFDILDYDAKLCTSKSSIVIQTYSKLSKGVIAKILTKVRHTVSSVVDAVENHDILVAVPDLKIFKLEFSTAGCLGDFYDDSLLEIQE